MSPDTRLVASTSQPAVTHSAADALSLRFVELTPQAMLDACRQLSASGVKRIGLRPFNAFAKALTQAAAQARIPVEFFPVDEALPLLDDRNGPTGLCVCTNDTEAVSRLLLDYLDLPGGHIVAPVTAHFWNARPLFLISVPKAGTHLLYKLAEQFGYAPGVVCPSEPTPGQWYCLEYSNSHTVARDFFVDTVRRSPFGNRHHPFLRSPALFIYRHPLDILVSEANYYHLDGRAAFAGYLSGLSLEERLLRLANDEWLLGSIRDRVGGFLPWLDVENVVPMSFEELVGANGGGTEAAQRALIWSLQLKLHVPGDPAVHGGAIFDAKSPTFREGRIGAYRESLTPAARAAISSLPQDYLEAFGYADEVSLTNRRGIPERAAEFLRRPLKTSRATIDLPVTVGSSYRDHNIVLYRGIYYTVPQRLGPVDLRSSRLQELVEAGECGTAQTLEIAQQQIDDDYVRRIARSRVTERRDVVSAPADTDSPHLVQEGYQGYNLVDYHGRVLAIQQEAGPVDLSTADIFDLETRGLCLVGDSLSGVRKLVSAVVQHRALNGKLAELERRHQEEAAELRRARDEAHQLTMQYGQELTRLRSEVDRSRSHVEVTAVQIVEALAAKSKADSVMHVLEQRLAEAESARDVLGAEVTARDARLTALETETHGLRARIDDLVANTARLSGQIEQWEAERIEYDRWIQRLHEDLAAARSNRGRWWRA